MVYTASSLSLATLELFVHIDPALIPDDLFAVSMEAPEDVSTERLGPEDLPKGWRNYPAPNKLKDLGNKWIVEQRSLLLIVPSAVNPEENNILVNPLHPEFERLRIISENPFHFDPRMWKK
jgi:RES domain-containing protein